MKIKIRKEQLISALNIAMKAVSMKTTMPILECFLLTADENGLCITANDTELAIETTVRGDDCTIMEAGRTAVEAKLFFEIVRKISNDVSSDISISSDGSIMEICCESSRFKIQERDPEQSPAIPEVSREKYVNLSQFTLKELIRDTIFSILPNDSNKMMTGELFEVKDQKLRVVSLDGHRISVRNTELRDDYSDVSVIIPGKTLNEISRILTGEADKDVSIFFSRNYCMFLFDNTKLVTRLIDGEYFRIDAMLSYDYETKVVVNKKDFTDCIERSTVLIRETDKKPIVLNIAENSIEIKMNSGMGTMNDEIMVSREGKDLMIGFNPYFLLDALKVIDDESVNLYMTNPKAPCFIRDDEGKYIYLILPVNFNPNMY